jgi:hypothetical protein
LCASGAELPAKKWKVFAELNEGLADQMGAQHIDIKNGADETVGIQLEQDPQPLTFPAQL